MAVCASVAANIFNFLHSSFFFIALPSFFLHSSFILPSFFLPLPTFFLLLLPSSSFFLPLPSSSSLAGHVTFAKSIKVRALQRFWSVELRQSVSQ